MLFKAFRIIVLLVVLASVWTTYSLQQQVSQDWKGTIDIQIIPVLADSDPATRNYVEGLKLDDFSEISKYLIAQAGRHDRDLQYALEIGLQAAIEKNPPPLPDIGAGRIQIALWSLKLRWWAWVNQAPGYHDTQIRLYVLYQSPGTDYILPHSTGLQNGLIGLINARVNDENKRVHAVVITHELLHILGATDKYDLISGQPVFPSGYAQPFKQPAHPQRRAELMARAIPLSETDHKVATRLSQTMIGDLTAREIGWID